jgi:hypothetical protein
MTHIFPIIEIHFYSSGLKAIHIGPQARPEWLPSFEIVGPRDIQLDNDDYVIELSRHERDNKLITWIGVWSKGVDLTAGDRGANYIGLGVWLIDALPTESYMIVSSLVKICDLLVKEGSPTEKVITTCSKLLNDPSYMQNWIKNIHELPLVDKGLVFQKDVYLQPIYIKSKDCDLQKAIISTSESILINCVNAVGDFKGKSQILYLILNSGSKADSNKPIKELINNPNLWLDYISILEQSNKDKNAGLEHDVDKLKIENQNKAHQIKINDENINNLNVRNQELTEELNKKTESEHLCDLQAYILNLIKQIEQQSEVLESKNNQGIREPTNTSPNSYDAVVRQIKDLHFLITNQTSTLSNLFVKANGSAKPNPDKPAIGKSPINKGFFSRYSVLIMSGITLALIAVIVYGVYSVNSPDEIKVIDVIQEQPQSRNINIDDVKELNSKLDNISSTVGSIENKIESSILAKETKIISPISLEQAPSNSGKIGNSKVSKKKSK